MARMTTPTYPVGTRVEIHPGCDAWMAGDRFGEIAKVGRKHIHVRMDRSGRTLRIPADRIFRTLD